ncbi:MAG: hypothetical protein MJZ25_02120 [Fibrobacter sp.]|nr:hypothetical protein [Fibrobacter sp.]
MTNRLFLVLVALGSVLLVSCAPSSPNLFEIGMQSLFPKNSGIEFGTMRLDYYREWNEIVLVGTDVRVKDTSREDEILDLAIEKAKVDSFCKENVFNEFSFSNASLYGDPLFIGEKIEQDSNFTVTCLYSHYDMPIHGYSNQFELQDWIKFLTRRQSQLFDQDSVYRIVYWGDSVYVESSQIKEHRSNSTFAEGTVVHEFYISKSEPVISIVAKHESSFPVVKRRAGNLLVESPRYKELKKREGL